MLDPKRAVLIEGRDARLGLHEVRSPLRSCHLHELYDRLLGWTVVLRRQRVLGAGKGEYQGEPYDGCEKG
jgi:hypothetical protein